MARRFSSCDFGPTTLRPLLRARVAPGERLVGWGVAERHGVSFFSALHLALGAVPVAGPIMSMTLRTQLRRFLVLTEARLLVTVVERRGVSPLGTGLVADIPVGELHVVEREEAALFDVRGEHANEDLGTLEVLEHNRPGPSRLVEGLRLLAEARAQEAPGGAPEGLRGAGEPR